MATFDGASAPTQDQRQFYDESVSAITPVIRYFGSATPISGRQQLCVAIVRAFYTVRGRRGVPLVQQPQVLRDKALEDDKVKEAVKKAIKLMG